MFPELRKKRLKSLRLALIKIKNLKNKTFYLLYKVKKTVKNNLIEIN